MSLLSGPSRTSELTVLRISKTEWRVSDPSKDESDGTAVVGFVEQRDDAFEATRLDATPTTVSWPTLSDAVRFLSRGS